MKKLFVFVMFCLLAFPHAAFSAPEGGEPVKKSRRAKSLIGSPVNANLAGGGTLPKGAGVTMLNASFGDKTRSKKGGGPDVFNQVWLLKTRYGLTSSLELGVVLPYINNKRSNHLSGSDHIEGLGDMTLQLTFAPLNRHQGDPLSVSFGAGLLLPTGIYGKNHLPGNGVWGGRLVAAASLWPTDDIRMDTEFIWTGPFERGNQRVKRGQQFQWNAFARYLFDNVDIGLESALTHTESGDKRFDFGTKNLRNGYTEWLVGPSMNVAVDSLGVWGGFGVFFPLVQDVKGPSKVEDVRFEFKMGKVW